MTCLDDYTLEIEGVDVSVNDNTFSSIMRICLLINGEIRITG